MKIKTFLGVSMAIAAMSSLCYGVQYVTFPANGTMNTAVTTGWTYSDAGLDRAAFYNNIGGTPAVSVGAYFDDYATAGPDFYINHAPGASINLTDAVLSWNFTITDATINPRNDFSFNLLNAANTNLATVNFVNAIGTPFWNVNINGSPNFVAVEQGGNYTINLAFGTSGADASYTASVNAFNTSGLITGGASQSIANVRIGASLGAGNATFGDSFITVIPEPGTTVLISIVPVLCLLRRRRD